MSDDRAYRLFVGTLNGEVVLDHINQRAWSVRSSIASLYGGDWKHAKRDGWRVVPVVVQKHSAWRSIRNGG